jgi:hypothetical protein
LDTVPFGRPIASAIRVSDSPSRSPSSIRTRSTADNRLHIFAIHHLYQSVAPVFPSKLESALSEGTSGILTPPHHQSDIAMTLE